MYCYIKTAAMYCYIKTAAMLAKQPLLTEPRLNDEERRHLVRSLMEKMATEREFRDTVCSMVYDRMRKDATFYSAIKNAIATRPDQTRQDEDLAMQDRSFITSFLAMIEEYTAFMRVRWLEARMPVAEQLPLGPSTVVDAVWHAHILDTRAYAAFCQRHFGRFEHHDPCMNNGQYAYTLKRLTETNTPHFADWWDHNETNEIVWDLNEDNILHTFTSDVMIGVGCG
jgi:hypothetical protein